MIFVELVRGTQGQWEAFTAKNHGSSEACAAVSLMVLNTVNSIEALTEQAFTCDYNEEGGFIRFALKEPCEPEAALLLDAMLLGLKSVKQQYPKELTLKDSCKP